MLGFSCGLRAGVPKHTARNIATNGHYVINIADQGLVEKLHRTAMEYPDDVSELDDVGLTSHSSSVIDTPRVAEAPIAMECVLDQILEFGRTRAQFIIGRVVNFYIRDGLLTDGKVDTAMLNPIARLGGPKYGVLGDVITLPSFPIGPS